MYEATTRNIRVTVEPEFLDDQSIPEEAHYFWAYTVRIFNEGEETVQLRTRYWHITDANGMVEEVRGRGVVGETPTLEPGEFASWIAPPERGINKQAVNFEYVKFKI